MLNQCRYAEKCTRPDCHFNHPPGRVVPPPWIAASVSAKGPTKCTIKGVMQSASSSSPAGNLCRYSEKCTRPDCHFNHPPGRTDTSTLRASGKGMNEVSGSPVGNLCRYGVQCTRSDCYFNHPPGREVPLSSSVDGSPVGNMCRYGEKCPRADCHFNHPPGRKKACAFYGTVNGCSNGEACPFLHAEVPTDGSNVIFVGNLPRRGHDGSIVVGSAELTQHFAKFGPILSARLKTDLSGASKGYGFVTFADAAAATEAVQSGHQFWDVKMKMAMDAFEIVDMDPFHIRFTHGTISFCFRNGKKLDDTIRSILSGTLTFEEFPFMDVLRHGGHHKSLSNRRLFIARVLASRGVVKTVKVKVLSFTSGRAQQVKEGQTKFERSNNTKNGGAHVLASRRCGVCRAYHTSEFLDSQVAAGGHNILMEQLQLISRPVRQRQRLPMSDIYGFLEGDSGSDGYYSDEYGFSFGLDSDDGYF